MFVAVLSAVALMFAGCDESDDAASYDLSGSWTFSVQSADGYVAFNNTSMTISSNGYQVTWMSDAPNGVAVLDTNTLTVTMEIESDPTVLDLSGTLVAPGYMSGGGTIDGYDGLRVAKWEARR
jgi:hypothetical protein